MKKYIEKMCSKLLSKIYFGLFNQIIASRIHVIVAQTFVKDMEGVRLEFDRPHAIERLKRNLVDGLFDMELLEIKEELAPDRIGTIFTAKINIFK